MSVSLLSPGEDQPLGRSPPENDIGLRSTAKVLGCGTIRYEEIAIFPCKASPGELVQIMMENGPEEWKAVMKPMGEFDAQVFNENGKQRLTLTPLSQDQHFTDVMHVLNITTEIKSSECASLSCEMHMGEDFANPWVKVADKWEFSRDTSEGIMLTRHMGWYQASCLCCWFPLTCPCLPPSSDVPLIQAETVIGVKGILEKYEQKLAETGSIELELGKG